MRYESSEPPIMAGICHCHMCQQWTGSAFMTMAMFSRTTLRFTKGEPQLYRSSSIKDKGFCSNCGSSLFDQCLVPKVARQFNPDMIWVQIGTLDHPEAVSIDFHYSVETELPWVHFDGDARRIRCDEDPALATAFAAAEAGEEEPAIRRL